LFAHFKLDPASADDIKQDLYKRLFVGTKNTDPQIGSFSGASNLTTWLNIVAMRQVIKSIQRQDKEHLVEDEILENIAAPCEDASIAVIKKAYQPQFRSSFRIALKALTARERNFLRCRVLDGLTVLQLGKLFGIHRATVFRWMATIRSKLLAETRQALANNLKADPDEVDSIVQALISQLQVTISDILGDSG
jgi:RNA polymerase sigma-70 factor (ECF subfamily)